MSELIKNRSELLFLYDVKDANPNGDPADENKPRIDEETGINIVTDVRLKRTIRDYLHDFKKQEIFVRKERDSEGGLKTKESIYEQYGSPNEVTKKCIDVRLFGGTFALKKKGGKKKKEETSEEEKPTERAFALTGPAQFKFGRSLHRVGEPTFVKGTTVMPSAEKKGAGTFTEAYILPYSLIVFYGIINENAAKETQLTEDDITLLLDGMWNGTKNLISRSKVGQTPRLLLKVNYKDDNYHIGDLDRLIKHKSDVSDEKLRDISDMTIDVTALVNTLKACKDKISSIDCKVDERVKTSIDGKEQSFCKIMKDAGFKVNEL